MFTPKPITPSGGSYRNWQPSVNLNFVTATQAANSLYITLADTDTTVKARMELIVKQLQPKGWYELAIYAFAHI